MIKSALILVFFSFVILNSCKEKSAYTTKQFFNSKGEHVGDSIFINKQIAKIVFKDSSYVIDSIVFKRYDNLKKTLKSEETYKNRKHIFENIEYYENENIKFYSFVSEENENILYERYYDKQGNLIDTIGQLFFQGYVTNINTENLEIKKGTSIRYKIFYPNPPDCDANLYIEYKDGTKYNVFAKNRFLNFLQTTVNDNNKTGVFEVEILLEMKEKKNKDNIVSYHNKLLFKVVD